MDIHAGENKAEGTSEEFVANGAQPSGVQQAPQLVTVEREDLLEYRIVELKAEKATLLVDMYARELQRAQIDVTQIGQEARKLVLRLEEKYKTNLQFNMITEDGLIVPRDPAQRDILKRQLQQR
jgi:hypothetical protein